MLKRILIAAGGVIALLGFVYLGISYVLYDQLANIEDGCTNRQNRPDHFTDHNGYWPADFDFSPYYMPTYQEVRFPSRQDGLEISAWYVEADPAAPAVIITHGKGSCKYSFTELTPAGMLWHNGFNVLLIDVRDAGDSTYEDGRSAIGNEEYQDVLGAWDWLVAEKGIPAEQIGLLGNSLGAATTLIAFSQEPRVAAAFVDSPFDNLPQIIREELDRNHYPHFLLPGGLWMARLIADDDLLAHNPSDAVRLAGDRPLYIVHGTADERIGVHHSQQLSDLAEENGANVTVWIIDGVGHVQAAATHTAEYQQRLVTFFTQALLK
jgi:uncharacterized protein